MRRPNQVAIVSNAVCIRKCRAGVPPAAKNIFAFARLMRANQLKWVALAVMAMVLGAEVSATAFGQGRVEQLRFAVAADGLLPLVEVGQPLQDRDVREGLNL
jgi:hypothetical protein